VSVVRPLPGLRKVAVFPGYTTFLDADTLTRAATPPGLEHAGPHVSPCGNYAAIPRYADDFTDIEVRDLRLGEIAGLVSRPLASARPTDLQAVADAAALDVPSEVSEAISLLRACLEQRFGADITIGRGAPQRTGDDIGLSTRETAC
jgi:hypothetical protein